MWRPKSRNILSGTDCTDREADTPNKQIALAAAAALDKKAQDLVVLDLQGISSFTDYFLICHGNSVRQTQAIADAVEERLRPEKIRARVEGYQEGDWILMDFVDFVVHIFTPERREYFDLERLWGDAPRVPVEGAAEPVSRRKRRALPKSL